MSENDASILARRFLDYVKHHKREHELMFEAAAAAKAASDIRIERLNELRQEVERDRSQFVKADVSEAREMRILEKVEDIDGRLRKAENDLASKTGASVAWIVAIGGFFTIIQVLIGFISSAR